MIRRNRIAFELLGKLLVFVAGCFLIAGSARGQGASATTPQFEASGSYSYVRTNRSSSSNGLNLHGGSGSLSYNFQSSVSLVGEFGAYRFTGLPSGITSTMYTYLFGPRVTLRRSSRVNPFAQVLLGGARLNASASGVEAGENAFAMAVGGGLDLFCNRHFSIRAGEVDYLLTRFASASGASATQNNLRISAGVVFRFGSR